jgi:hypothetical protein
VLLWVTRDGSWPERPTAAACIFERVSAHKAIAR